MFWRLSVLDFHFEFEFEFDVDSGDDRDRRIHGIEQRHTVSFTHLRLIFIGHIRIQETIIRSIHGVIGSCCSFFACLYVDMI